MELPTLTALLTYRLNGPVEAFNAAAWRLAQRVQTDGHPGVLTYRFFSSDSMSAARAVVDYRDPEAWIGHHEVVMDWPEMVALREAATLTDITFLGAVSPAMVDWLAKSGIRAEVHHGARLAAGFFRF